MRWKGKPKPIAGALRSLEKYAFIPVKLTCGDWLWFDRYSIVQYYDATRNIWVNDTISQAEFENLLHEQNLVIRHILESLPYPINNKVNGTVETLTYVCEKRGAR